MLQLTDPTPSVKALYPSALCLYGSWLAETRSENPSVIMEWYLERSVELMEELRGRSERQLRGDVVSAYLTLARQVKILKKNVEGFIPPICLNVFHMFCKMSLPIQR